MPGSSSSSGGEKEQEEKLYLLDPGISFISNSDSGSGSDAGRGSSCSPSFSWKIPPSSSYFSKIFMIASCL